MTELAALVYFGLFIALLCLGTSIAISLGITAIVVIWTWHLGAAGISPTFYANIAKFQLLAIPFFIMAGLLLERCGISARLVHLASLLIGPVHGGLALVAVVCCVFFAGISGSGPADTAALGTILIPAMAIVEHFRWSPVWFGVVMTMNVAIGQVTPPVAVNLYVAANIARLRFESIAAAVWPFVLTMVAALAIVAAFPGLPMWLPSAFGLR